MYDYGARFYDPSISLWTSVDPWAERYPSWSPYNYVYDNPVIHTDPNGKGPVKRFFKKMVKNTIRRGGKIDLKSDFMDTFQDYADAAMTFGDGVWGIDDVVTAFELITDIDMEDLQTMRKYYKKIVKKFGFDELTAPKPGARTLPKDLEEKLSLEEAKSGAGQKYRGKTGDSKYDSKTGTHDKMEYNHEHPDKTKTEIHYDKDRKTGEGSNYKIKDDTNQKSRNKKYDGPA